MLGKILKFYQPLIRLRRPARPSGTRLRDNIESLIDIRKICLNFTLTPSNLDE